MRLIDADKLSEIIGLRIKDYSRDSNGGAQKLAICYKELKNLIDNQPTAYDVDKVVEQLEIKSRGKWGYPSPIELEDAVEIIRRSGITNKPD